MVPAMMPRRRFYLRKRNGERRLVYTMYGTAVNGSGSTVSWLFATHFPGGHDQGAIEIEDDMWEVGTE